MRKLVLTLVILAFVCTGTASAQLNSAWNEFSGPTGHFYARMGTDAIDLYICTEENQLWKYSDFDTQSGLNGVWTQLADCPRIITDWDSYKGLAFQNGYLYTTAIPDGGIGGRTAVRYEIAADSWEVWQYGGVDLNHCNSSGNGMLMDPTQDGVGYSAWHAGGHWVQFDWTAQTADNAWKNTGAMGVQDPGWISRNEMAAYDGNTGTYYLTHNDWDADLLPNGPTPDGDVIYTFTLAGAPVALALKPWKCGYGQDLEFVAPGNALNESGYDEIWLFRGCDGLASPHEGWGNGTDDYAVMPLAGPNALTWTTGKTPDSMAGSTEAVLIGELIFVKSGGIVGVSGDENNYVFMVAATKSASLTIESFELPAGVGGTVDFDLDSGASNAGRNYFLLGGVTGTHPGLPLSGGLVLPINWDLFTGLTFKLANTPAFDQFQGSLDGLGQSWATMDTLGPLPPTAVGVKMYFAYLQYGPFNFVSNPVTIIVTP